jgi:hypothetical protein
MYGGADRMEAGMKHTLLYASGLAAILLLDPMFLPFVRR